MADVDRQTVAILRQKAALLLQRERSLSTLRQQHEQVRAWLQALQLLSAELSLAEGETVIHTRAAQMLTQELHFRTAAVLSLAIDSPIATVVATAGHEPAALCDVSVKLSVQARRQLDGRLPGSCQAASEDPQQGALGTDLGLERFMWCPVVVDEHEIIVLVGGHDASVAPMCPPFLASDLTYFALIGQHVEALVRNARLVTDLRSERERLAALNLELEERVIGRTSELARANSELRENVETLRATQDQLVVTSRQAGMAEIATGVLHNLGNALNSVSVIAGLLRSRLDDPAGNGLSKLAELVAAHTDDWTDFVTSDAKGRLLPDFIGLLAKHTHSERRQISRDVDELNEHVHRARRVLAAQQSFAKHASVLETVRLSELVDDGVRLVDVALRRAQVQVHRNYVGDPTLVSDRHHVLEILVNLLTNAIDAMSETAVDSRSITVSLAELGEGGAEVIVRDTGSGIEPHMLARIFSHGVTTKPTGHGFGLHISSLSARKLGATLEAESAGSGQGATFRLRLPARSAGDEAEPATTSTLRSA